MSRGRHYWTRFSLKCAFTAILAFVSLTFILTFALFGRHGKGISVSTEQRKSSWDPSRKVWRGVGGGDRSVNMQIGDGSDRKVSISTPEERRRLDVDDRGEGQRSSRRRDSEMGSGRVDKANRVQANEVVNLLNMEPKGFNLTQEKLVPRKLLMAQIELLRDAMISHSSMLTQPSVPPSCAGDVQEGEVEDLLCIPKPKYLKHVKNPCWYDLNPSGSKQPKLYCLPYFHILGCAKSGTTDLWMRLMSHPHIVANKGALRKEGLWWSWQRYGFSGYKRMPPVTFNSYVHLFRDTARQIQSSLNHGDDLNQLLITGDASPPDFWDFRGWPNITQNRGLQWPRVITPHLMQHFYDKPKFILMFRDPIDRLYSDYFFIGGGLTAQDFHQDVVRSISLLADCVKRWNIQGCFNNQRLYLQLPVRLPFACYSVFMREWLQVFPLEKFFFIKTEEYEANPEETLKDVIDFLDLHPLRETKIQEMVEEERARITLQKKVAGPMKASTKALLTSLLQPCSHMLARLIKQPRFVWDT